MIISIELTMERCYKVIMLGVNIDRQEKNLIKNERMLISCSIPYRTPKNNQNDIAYHWLREYGATGVIKLKNSTGKYNTYYLLTNTLVIQNHYPLMKELLVKLNFIHEGDCINHI